LTVVPPKEKEEEDEEEKKKGKKKISKWWLKHRPQDLIHICLRVANIRTSSTVFDIL
jgi:hypothetical protein